MAEAHSTHKSTSTPDDTHDTHLVRLLSLLHSLAHAARLLAEKKAPRVSCRSIAGETSCKRVSLPNFRGVELPPPTVSPVLMHLCLPHTANISIQVLHDDLFDSFFREILPQSLEGLPGIAWTTSLQYGDAQSIAGVFSGTNPAGGVIQSLMAL